MDFHTHNQATPPGAGIVCLPQEVLLCPDSFAPVTGGLYAAGIHPWWTAQADFDGERHLEALRRLAAHPQVVQVGECGIDLLRGADVAVQRELFVRQVSISEELGKPMTLHCVRAFDQLLSLKKQLRPSQQWTIHGFRGKPALARQLLAAGFDLSFGALRNEDSYALTPPDRRHDETD